MLVGMDRITGLPITGHDRLRQSIGDILTTPLGSRRMRPEYGSTIPRMVDLPVNAGLISAMQAEAARAIGRWEPEFILSRVKLTALIEGTPTFVLSGEFGGQALEITV